MAPHDLFRVRTADEVAECWDGVSPSLYKALWNDVVHVMPIDNGDSTEDECFDDRSALVNYWDRLSADHQVELNELARTRSAAA